MNQIQRALGRCCDCLPIWRPLIRPERRSMNSAGHGASFSRFSNLRGENRVLCCFSTSDSRQRDSDALLRWTCLLDRSSLRFICWSFVQARWAAIRHCLMRVVGCRRFWWNHGRRAFESWPGRSIRAMHPTSQSRGRRIRSRASSMDICSKTTASFSKRGNRSNIHTATPIVRGSISVIGSIVSVPGTPSDRMSGIAPTASTIMIPSAANGAR